VGPKIINAELMAEKEDTSKINTAKIGFTIYNTV
jgi:hypothetical protein